MGLQFRPVHPTEIGDGQIEEKRHSGTGGRREQASATRGLPKRRKSLSASPDYYAIPTAASGGAPLPLRYSDEEDISRHAATGEVNGTGIMSSRTSIFVEAKIQGDRQLFHDIVEGL